MQLKIFPSGPLETNTYLHCCPQTKQAVVIDAAKDSTELIQDYLKKHGLTITYILLTHSHWDHIADVEALKKATHAKVCIHSLDVPNLRKPGSDQLPCPFFIPSVEPDILLKEGDQIQVGNATLTVIHTPGHSPGSICFYDKENGILFSGDTLFKGAIGNISFPTSRPDLMEESLQKLAALPQDTIVYPGHGPSTKIKYEV